MEKFTLLSGFLCLSSYVNLHPISTALRPNWLNLGSKTSSSVYRFVYKCLSFVLPRLSDVSFLSLLLYYRHSLGTMILFSRKNTIFRKNFEDGRRIWCKLRLFFFADFGFQMPRGGGGVLLNTRLGLRHQRHFRYTTLPGRYYQNAQLIPENKC